MQLAAQYDSIVLNFALGDRGDDTDCSASDNPDDIADERGERKR
jgi:hypothetical protein